MHPFLAAILGTVLVATPFHAEAADIQIRVATVKGSAGVIHADICRAVEWLKNGCAFSAQAPATPGLTVVTVHNVPPGVWAIVAYHDRNENGKVDQNLLGIPQEGVGFSNNPALGLRGPRFGDAAVTIGEDGGTVDIKLLFE